MADANDNKKQIIIAEDGLEQEEAEKSIDEMTGAALDLLSRCGKLSFSQRDSHLRPKKSHGHDSQLVKLVTKVKSEIAFLSNLKKGKVKVKKSHLLGSNLPHLRAVVEVAEREIDISGLVQKFSFEENDGFGGSHSKNFLVDVVSRDGLCWIKISARKKAALQAQYLGEGEYGEEGVAGVARDALAAAAQNPIGFTQPHVAFFFAQGISEDIREELEDLGVSVHTELDEMGSYIQKQFSAPLESTFGVSQTRSPVLKELGIRDDEGVVNIDCTTLVALVSELTNSDPNKVFFKDPILTMIHKQELSTPSMPMIEEFLKGKRWLVSRSTMDAFHRIVSLIGGLREQERAQKLLGQVLVVEDHASPRCAHIKSTTSLKAQTLATFVTGDALGVPTISSNHSFIRAASRQGVHFHVWLHPAVVLTEKNQVFVTDQSEADAAPYDKEEKTNQIQRDAFNEERKELQLPPSSSSGPATLEQVPHSKDYVRSDDVTTKTETSRIS